ncbi:AfsR/SARP family transcriptional regulator [Nonomuraea helvata]|uniref:BTAD domain-containing putative transcriptional regulator n=1 Tax=Nonomuraea helvata TaxID=37484 RepID=A0ABV5RYP2_9ACTN
MGGEIAGVEIDLGPPRQQATMVMLAGPPGRVVTMGQLVEGLWGATPPASAEQSVYTYIAGLRRALEPDRRPREPSRLLIGTAGGYRLDIDPSLVDSHVFAACLDAARQAKLDGDLDNALGELQQALALWRGPALSGVPGPFAETERARLEELHVTAVEARADVLVCLGRPQEALDGLPELIRSRPLRERLRELLMLALHGCGRQAEALEVFEEARRVLTEELGVNPGAGLRHAYQLVLRGGGTAAEESTPRQLPRDLLGFVGRTPEIVRLRSLLVPPDDARPHPFVAISGPPGVGKSALAVHVAHLAKERFPDGQLFVGLHGATPNVAPLSTHEISSRLLRGLGTPDHAIPADADESAALWRSRLHGKRILVLLDDAAGLGQVRPFLSAPLGVAVLVTSRESLAAGDDCVQLRLGPLSDADATTMLAGLAGAGRASADLGQTMRLVRLCDGLPLALRIAGARLADRPELSVGALTARLSDERSRLRELESGELAVRSSLASSWNTLRDSSRPADRAAARMLALLGLFHVPDMTAELAAPLAGCSPAEAGHALERLSDAHLLERGGQERYHLHDLVRLFAAELPPPEGRVAPLVRVLTYAAASARTAARISDPHRVHCSYPKVEGGGRRFESQEEAYEWLRVEESTLLAAAFQAIDHPDDEIVRLGAAVGFALWWYQQKGFRVPDTIAMGTRLLAAGDRLQDDVITMEAHAYIATGLHFKGDLATARQHNEQHLQLAKQLGDRFNEQRAHGNLASVHAAREEFDDASRHALAQRKIAREISSAVGERYALQALGRAYRGLGRPYDAMAVLEEMIAMAERAGDTMHMSVGGSLLGQVFLDLGETLRARDLLERTLTQARAVRVKTAEVACLTRLATAHRLLGSPDEASRRAAEAIALARQMGSADWLERAVEEQEALSDQRAAPRSTR